MRFALLAAAAVFATPVFAQETPATAPTDQTVPAGDPSQADATATAAGAPQGDPSMQNPPPAAPTDPNMPAPAGGYQPSTMGAGGPAQPGAQVVFQPAPSPSQAFPPPPPMAKYPICKKGQYDKCMQRGGK